MDLLPTFLFHSMCSQSFSEIPPTYPADSSIYICIGFAAIVRLILNNSGLLWYVLPFCDPTQAILILLPLHAASALVRD